MQLTRQLTRTPASRGATTRGCCHRTSVARASAVQARAAAPVTLAPPSPSPAPYQPAAAGAVQQRVLSGGDDAVSPAWAIVRVNGTQQFLEVGSCVAVRSSHIQATDGVVRFSEVLAAKHPLSGTLYRGGPHCVVEGQVVEEFQGPSAASLPAGLDQPAQQQQQPLRLTKVLITKIEVAAPSTRQ